MGTREEKTYSRNAFLTPFLQRKTALTLLFASALPTICAFHGFGFRTSFEHLSSTEWTARGRFTRRLEIYLRQNAVLLEFWKISVIYHATERPRSIGTRVHLELTIIKSHYGSLEVIMGSSMTSASYSSSRRRSWMNSREEVSKSFSTLKLHDKGITMQLKAQDP